QQRPRSTEVLGLILIFLGSTTATLHRGALTAGASSATARLLRRAGRHGGSQAPLLAAQRALGSVGRSSPWTQTGRSRSLSKTCSVNKAFVDDQLHPSRTELASLGVPQFGCCADVIRHDEDRIEEASQEA